MNPFNIRSILHSLLLLLIVYQVDAQVYVQTSVEHSCNDVGLGSIELIFDPAILTDYPLVYQAEWENTSNGDYALFEISNLNYKLDSLEAGWYEITIYLSETCMVILEEEVFAPYFDIQLNDSQCLCGRSKTAINATVMGQGAPYTYQWTGPQGFTSNEEDILVDIAGTYTLIVTDANNTCTNYDYVSVDQCETCGREHSFEIVNSSGPNSQDGGVLVNAPLGDFTYQWDNGVIERDNNNLSPGEYCVLIGGDHCCPERLCFNVGDNCAKPLASIVTTSPSCPGNIDGSILITDLQGTAPYIFEWSNGSNTQDLIDVTAGIYGVSITDAFGCTMQEEIELSEKSLDLSVDYNYVCMGSGGIDLTVSEGNSSYTYEWSDSSTNEDLSVTVAGNYCVSITDVDACEYVECFELPNALELRIADLKNISYCVGATPCSGSVDLEVDNYSGGNLTYQWYGDGFTSTDQDIDGLCPGNYHVIVTNEMGCSSVNFVSICCCGGYDDQDDTDPTVNEESGLHGFVTMMIQSHII